jgi:glyoxylase I family protein
MAGILGVHHIAIICRDYQRSKEFYTGVLDFEIMGEQFRPERNSWKLDLGLNGVYLIELFSFLDPPPRVSNPEAAGLRHLAFAVADLAASIASLHLKGIETEPVRKDPYTGKCFTFFQDPDGLPIELYEV